MGHSAWHSKRFVFPNHFFFCYIIFALLLKLVVYTSWWLAWLAGGAIAKKFLEPIWQLNLEFMIGVSRFFHPIKLWSLAWFPSGGTETGGAQYTKDTMVWVRAVASLTIPGGQKFQFPYFSSNSNQFFLPFLIFLLTLALLVGESPTREGPGYATGQSPVPQ